MDMAKDIFSEMDYDYVKVVPYQIKKIAVKDCYQALVNGCRKTKKTGETFKLSFRTRKTPKQSCYIPKQALKKRRYISHNSWKTKNKRKAVAEL